jgi:hypothetical protein
MQGLWSQRVSSALKHLGALQPQTGKDGFTNWSNRFLPDSHTKSSVLALWLSQVTLWYCGEPLETPRTSCSLPPILTHDLTSTSFELDLCFEAQPKNRPWLRLLFLPSCGPHLTPWLTGPSNQANLSVPHLEASPVSTFRACSSPAPAPITPQPAPAILIQELVHTTLSITHHTWKQPSTGPRTTGPH